MADFIRVGHTVHIVLTVDHSDEFMTYLNRLIRLDELTEPNDPLAVTNHREYAAAYHAAWNAEFDAMNAIRDGATNSMIDTYAQHLDLIEEAEALAEMGVS